MEYNQLVSKLREIARDQLRLKIIAGVRTTILQINNELDSIAKTENDFQKSIAIAQYKISKLDDADPEKGDKLARLEGDIKHYNAHITDLADAKVRYQADATKEEEFINKVQAGEVKVDMDSLEAITKSLIEEVCRATAVAANQ